MKHRRTIDSKIRWYAWILLLVFLPIFFVSTVHYHEGPSTTEICYSCAHHLHHPSHMANGAGSTTAECVLCHFLALSYLPSLALVILPLASYIVVKTTLRRCKKLSQAYGHNLLRGPPQVL